MSKISLSTKLVNILPNSLKEAANIIRHINKDDIANATVSATSLTGLLIGVFAQPIAEKYLKKKEKNQKESKLHDLGFDTYMEASFELAEYCLHQIAKLLGVEVDMEKAGEAIQRAFEKITEKTNKDDYILAFKPKFHPAVQFVRESYITMLTEIGIEVNITEKFEKEFNDKIESKIVENFGDFYEAHLQDITDNWLIETEIEFLKKMKALSRIGFKDGENLEYQPTYAYLEQVDNFNKKENEIKVEDLEDRESKLSLIEELIEGYFDNETPDKHIEKICFVISDFGKGKSVFMKQYAARLASEYLRTGGSGAFPIYFNLREYGQFSSTQHGVIDDFMQIRHSIKLSDSHFKKKEFIFLIDSLDESGELTRRNIDSVIESIKNIQRIDPTKSFKNKIIITSRPIDEGLKNHLTGHKPFVQKEEERECYYYISIYGFKKNQFNSYILNNIKGSTNVANLSPTGFAKEVINAVIESKQLDIYSKLIEDNTLSVSELRRPIFAYSIYQLILNNIDFASLGKIGVYLSFLNLLTKEAKHIESKEIKVNLAEEFKFRNILHATAALWMFERQTGNQGVLNKADICRAIKGELIDSDDRNVLEQFKEVNEIKFFSHSYFGQEGNNLHFEHQSFAEILLAEYYLKILIKYALDEEDPLEARVKLTIGEPTAQTVEFLKELIQLLRECAEKNNSKIIIEKRRLLFRLLASISTKENNNLFCKHLFYTWFNKVKINEGDKYVSDEYLNDWPISEIELSKISALCIEIIDSDKQLIFASTTPKSSIFNNEVSLVKSHGNIPPDIDKWICLLCGNILKNRIDKLVFFNQSIPKAEKLFELIKNWNHFAGTSTPGNWATGLFRGINMSNYSEPQRSYSGLNYSRIDFSYSLFKSIDFSESNLSMCNFEYCIFDTIDFRWSKLRGVKLQNSKIVNNSSFNMELCELDQGLQSPYTLCQKLYRINSKTSEKALGSEWGKFQFFGLLSSFGNATSVISYEAGEMIAPIVNTLFPLFKFLFESGLMEKDILEGFNFTEKKVKNRFIKELRKLRKNEHNVKIEREFIDSIIDREDFMSVIFQKKD